MRFLLPQGIGDSLWALTKIEGIARCHGVDGGRVDLAVAIGHDNEVETRSVPFLRAFRFVDAVTAAKAGNLLIDEFHHPTTPEGYYNYLPEGTVRIGEEAFHLLIPNTVLEQGRRLEEWRPEVAVRWNVMDDFQIPAPDSAFADRQRRMEGPYCMLYACSIPANTENGHNRGPLWTPRQWAELMGRIWTEWGLLPWFIGAPYDRDYFQAHIRPLIPRGVEYKHSWEWPITRTVAMLRQAVFVVAYQSGIGVVSSYLGVPTAMWWRPKGDSVCPRFYLSPEEAMSTAWVDPARLSDGTYLPLIYGRHGVELILAGIAERGWLARKETVVCPS